MASASTPLHLTNRVNLKKSHFERTVCLTDWWLVEGEDGIKGTGLAVAGYTLERKRAVRVFSSAPILRRHDAFTVHTTDGICVILNGFMNKDRTLENGYPSDVCKHFLFGFPSYWKEYYEKFMGKESSSNDISVNLLNNPLLHSGMEAGKTDVDSHEKDFGSQGKMSAKGIQESKKTESSAVPLTQGFGSVSGGYKDNFCMSWIASDGPERESYHGGCSDDGHTTLELPVNCLKNTIKLLPDSSCEGNINVSAVIDKDLEYSQINDSRGILSACHLYNGRRKREIDDLRVESDKNNSTNANFDKDMRLSKDIVSCNDVGVMTRRMSILKMKQKNNQTSSRISGSEKISLSSVPSIASEKVESASVDCQPGRGNNLNFEGFDQVPNTKNQDKGMRKIKTRSQTQKVKNKATKSPHTPAAADNQMDMKNAGTYSLSKKAKASTVETGRKLYGSKETPDSGKKKVPSASPQPLSFNRSRSGRVLMPTLEFWRNQIPIYDVNRTMTGIEEVKWFTEPKTGSGSTSQMNKTKS